MTVILFLIMISVLVVFHEWGHLLVAKFNKITVREFWIGMGPTLFSWGKGLTRYKLKLLPIGGACVFEEDLENKEEEKADETEADEIVAAKEDAGDDTETTSEEKIGKFCDAGIGSRFWTIAAGPLFNFLLAYLFALILVGNSYVDKPVLQAVREGFPAQEAGMQAGDVITKVGNHRIYLAREIAVATSLYPGESKEFTYERDGKEYTVSLTPKMDEEEGRALFGFEGYADYFRCTPLQVIPYAYYEVRFNLYSTLESLKLVVLGRVSSDNVSGPVGIAKIVGDVAKASRPYGILAVVLNLMNLAMLLSVNLGVMNLLPIPALDGGRLLFVILEMIRRKPVPPEKENLVHMAGFVLIILLMVLMLYHDIVKIFF